MRAIPMGRINWKPAEQEIVRSCSISECLKLLPHRTKMAIKTARVKLRVGPRQCAWTKAEKRRLLKYCHEPVLKLAKRFKNRTLISVTRQKSVFSPSRSLNPWKTTDLAKLGKLFPSAPRNVLLSTFPARTWIAIREQAATQGWRRIRSFVTVPNELRDAVRIRAREDGISLGKLGIQTGCGSYFEDGGGKTVDLNKIARAVEFFGGKLVIDWQDE
jgi:hypothetical protein